MCYRSRNSWFRSRSRFFFFWILPSAFRCSFSFVSPFLSLQLLSLFPFSVSEPLGESPSGSWQQQVSVKHLLMIIVVIHATYLAHPAHKLFSFTPQPSFTDGEASSGGQVSCLCFKAGVCALWAGYARFSWRLVTPVHSRGARGRCARTQSRSRAAPSWPRCLLSQIAAPAVPSPPPSPVPPFLSGRGLRW